MEGLITNAFAWSAIWWVVTNYAEIGVYAVLPNKLNWLSSLICWKCWAFLGTLALTFDLPLAASASLIAAFADAYLSNKTITL